MSEPKCENCRFFLEHDKGCHRYAPRPSDGFGDWPMVELHHWCGEHEPRGDESDD